MRSLNRQHTEMLAYGWTMALPFVMASDFLLLRLRFHLLNFDGIGLASTHVQLVIAHAQRENASIDTKSRRVEDEIRRLLLHGFNDEFLIVERDVANFAPWKADLRCQSKRTAPSNGSFSFSRRTYLSCLS